MAIKRIDEDRLFQPKITKKLIKELDDLIKKGDETSESLIKIRDVLKEINEIKNAEQFKLFTTETEKLNKAQAELVKTEEKLAKVQEKILKEAIKQQKVNKAVSKTEKEKLKLLEELKRARSDEIQGNEELKLQLQSQRKVNKELAKDKLGLIGAFDKEKARLKDLQKNYKDLRIENKKDTKETKELAKEIKELSDELTEASESAQDFGFSFAKNAKAAGEGGKKGFNTLFAFIAGAGVDAFARSRDELRTFTVGLEKAKNFIAITAFALIDLFRDKVIPIIQNFAKEVKISFLEFKLLGEKALGPFKDQTIIDDLTSQITTLNGEIKANQELIDQAVNPFENFIDKVKESNAVLEEQLLLEDEIINRTIELTIQIEKLAGEQERLTATAGDSTISFAKQAEAIEQALVVQGKRLELEKELAEEQQKAALLAVRNDLIRRGVSDQVTDAQIRNLSFIKDRELADKVSIESLQRVAEANLTLLAIQEERLSFDREAGQARREISRDRFEQDLDFAIDAFDSIKTLRERQIADETIDFNTRFEQLNNLKALAESSFQSQVQLVKNITDQRINLEELVDIEDERVLRSKLINDASLTDEIIILRILETVRERRTVTRDLVDAEQDLTEALKEQLEVSDELFNEIEKTRRAGIIAAQDDAEKNRQLRETDLKLQAKFETDLAQDSADQRILIAEKLKNDLAAIERERVADVEAANKKIAEDDERLKQERIDNAVEFGNKVFDSLRSQLERQNDLFNEALNNEITSLQESIDRQLESNRVGGEQKLADDQALLAKRELERKRALEAQAKQERLIALAQQFVNAAAAHAKDDPEGAIVKALAEVFAAEGIAKLIAGFYDAGYTGDGNDREVAGVVHKGEMVQTAKQTTKYGMKGWSAQDFDKKINEGYFNQFATNNINIPEHLFKNIDPGGMTPGAFDSSSINKGQKDAANQIANAIKDESFDPEIFLDELAQVVTKLTKGGKTEKVIYERDLNRF